VITRLQLRALGFSDEAIDYRLERGRLRALFRGVFWVGATPVTQHGWWIAAVLACGPGAVLSHRSAAAMWHVLPVEREIHVSTPHDRRHPGICTHRRRLSPVDVTRRANIPITSVVCTLVDIAPGLTRHELEGAVNEADKLGLIHPEALRQELDNTHNRAGLPKLKHTLDRHTYVMTDTELERRFLPIARRAGLPLPLTQVYVNGYRVDFYWPELGLVVETDGLTYHRTPAEQAEDRRRDQAHTAAGLTALRFTRAQVRYEPAHVEEILTAVARRLLAGPPGAVAGESR
jgi:very-short-patch-repair endonuclease